MDSLTRFYRFVRLRLHHQLHDVWHLAHRLPIQLLNSTRPPFIYPSRPSHAKQEPSTIASRIVHPLSRGSSSTDKSCNSASFRHNFEFGRRVYLRLSELDEASTGQRDRTIGAIDGVDSVRHNNLRYA